MESVTLALLAGQLVLPCHSNGDSLHRRACSSDQLLGKANPWDRKMLNVTGFLKLCPAQEVEVSDLEKRGGWECQM